MAQQTAIDWLEQEYKKWYRKGNPIILKLIKQAKQMEKEQIMEALVDGRAQYRDRRVIPAEQYYNETYGED